jgi:hypothetical protein
MGENLEIEPFSQLVQQYDDSLFQTLPTDLRFQKVCTIVTRVICQPLKLTHFRSHIKNTRQ